jgi:hypothetical protein
VQIITVLNIPCHSLYQRQFSIHTERTPSAAVMQQGPATDQSPPCSVEVKNWNGTVGLPPLPNVP